METISAADRTRIHRSCGQVAHLGREQGVEGAAEREDRPERFALVHLRQHDRHVGRKQFLSDMAEQARADYRAGAGETAPCAGSAGQNAFFLLTDQLDSFGSLCGVKLTALDRDDDQVGPADRVGNGHAGRAFQVDDHERHARRPKPRSRR